MALYVCMNHNCDFAVSMCVFPGNKKHGFAKAEIWLDDGSKLNPTFCYFSYRWDEIEINNTPQRKEKPIKKGKEKLNQNTEKNIINAKL